MEKVVVDGIKLDGVSLDAISKRVKRLNEGAKYNVVGVSLSAGIESFYRSLLNSLLVNKLAAKNGASTGFSLMWVQFPTRIVYINGFKLINQQLEQISRPRHMASLSTNNEPDKLSTVKRYGLGLIPGLLMTPFSSVLEASVVASKTPLYLRFQHGYAFRTIRECIFGVGLLTFSNELIEKTGSTVLGSLHAGMICGYLTHIPNNLSVLKLLHPTTSYKTLFTDHVLHGPVNIPSVTNPAFSVFSPIRRLVSTYPTIYNILVPKGLLIRSTQITGTFLLLNGIQAASSHYIAG